METMERTEYYKLNKTGRHRLFAFTSYGQKEEVEISERLSFGRKAGGADADFVLSAPALSRQHGEFGISADTCLYRDLGSKNGTYVNGILCSDICSLSDGDVLSTGYRHEPEKQMEVRLLYARSDDTYNWSEIELTADMQEIVIGRGEEGLQLQDTHVSRRHASFFQSSRGWFILDLQSTNGVYLNGIKLEGEAALKELDLIRIGQCIFLFYSDRLLVGQPAAVESEKRLMIEISEKNVWSRFKKKTLLRDIHLTVSPGDMVLILGGSGAGKTTFMNAVMGYEKAEGSISYGDLDLYQEYEKIKYEIGYVPQQDLLRLNDTVYHTLYRSVQMKTASDMSKEKQKQRVEEILDLLGLVPERDTLAGNLSGGQRKRLSIGVELAGDPSLFFLDEPDSGLDGIMAENLMKILKKIADLGKIVMIITHGPDRGINLFSKVIVLAKSEVDHIGHLAYYGTPNAAKTYFEVDSLEGIVRKINRKDEGGEGLADYYIEKYNRKVRQL